MKNLYIGATVSILAFAAFGCGSNTNTSVNVNSRTSSNTPAAQSNGSDGLTVEVVPLDPKQANLSNSGNYGSNSNQRPVVDAPGSMPAAKPREVIAPENSVVTVSSNESGDFIETRVFKSDPLIAKVEKTTNGKSRTAKIFLKTGRVVNVDGDKIALINSTQLSTLKELAGVGTPAKDPGKAAAYDKPKQ